MIVGIFLKDYLMNAKNENNLFLFIGAEQGSGKYEKDIYIIYMLLIKNEVYY